MTISRKGGLESQKLPTTAQMGGGGRCKMLQKGREKGVSPDPDSGNAVHYAGHTDTNLTFSFFLPSPLSCLIDTK